MSTVRGMFARNMGKARHEQHSRIIGGYRQQNSCPPVLLLVRAHPAFASRFLQDNELTGWLPREIGQLTGLKKM
jgi:hypothetical protein